LGLSVKAVRKPQEVFLLKRRPKKLKVVLEGTTAIPTTWRSCMVSELHHYKKNIMTREGMNRLLLGTVLAAVAGGVIYYLNNREEMDDRLGNLRDRASDALGKAKDKVSQRADDVRARMNR
jgi:hypothetical protein